jgi:hypothetical protein
LPWQVTAYEVKSACAFVAQLYLLPPANLDFHHALEGFPFRLAARIKPDGV